MRILIVFLIVLHIVSGCFGNSYARGADDEDREHRPEVDSMGADHSDVNNDNNDDPIDNGHSDYETFRKPFWNSFRLSKQFNSNRTLFFKPKTRAPLLDPPSTRVNNQQSSTSIKPIFKVIKSYQQPSLVKDNQPSPTVSIKKTDEKKKFNQQLTTSTSTTSTTTTTTTTTTATTESITSGSVLIMSNEPDGDSSFDYTTPLITGSLLEVTEPNN